MPSRSAAKTAVRKVAQAARDIVKVRAKANTLWAAAEDAAKNAAAAAQHGDWSTAKAKAWAAAAALVAAQAEAEAAAKRAVAWYKVR